MDSYTTMRVENLANIGKVDIELTPLIFFIGDNNSGKSYLANYIFENIESINKSYFPITRSGLLLACSDITNGTCQKLTSTQKWFIDQVAKGYLNGRTSNSSIIKIIDFIESKIIRGKVEVQQEKPGEYLYQANHLEKPIPMSLSSGMVTSLAPLLASLKYSNIGNYCFIEEPEMSLHPELEWRMAQVLVRLANAGIMVLAITHSATIIQHVNNMIKLSNREDRRELAKEYGYEPEDIISSDMVRMYQFDVNENDGMTGVKPLEHSVNGFSVPTFGHYLRKLKDQIWDFQIEP